MQGSNYLSRGIQEAHLWPSWPNSMLSPLHLHKTRTLRWQDWIPSRQLHDSTCQGRHIPWWRQSLLRQDRNWLDHVGLLWLHLPQQGWILARRILNQLFYNFLFASVRSTKHFLCLEFFSAIKNLSQLTNEKKTQCRLIIHSTVQPHRKKCCRGHEQKPLQDFKFLVFFMHRRSSFTAGISILSLCLLSSCLDRIFVVFRFWIETRRCDRQNYKLSFQKLTHECNFQTIDGQSA